MKNNTILVYGGDRREVSCEEININLFKSLKTDNEVNGHLTEKFFSYLLQDQFGIFGQRKVYHKDSFAIEFDERTAENKLLSSAACIPFTMSFLLITHKKCFFKRLFNAFKS